MVIINLVILVIGWFAAGTILNFILVQMQGNFEETEFGGCLHTILNIATVLFGLYLIFG